MKPATLAVDDTRRRRTRLRRLRVDSVTRRLLVLALAATGEEERRRCREEKEEFRSHAIDTRADARRIQVSVYSGPEPPSGGVSRPPFAVIAPHWTQFDGVTATPSSVTS